MGENMPFEIALLLLLEEYEDEDVHLICAELETAADRLRNEDAKAGEG